MKSLTMAVLLLVEFLTNAQANVFKRYFAVNGSMVKGDWTTVLGHGIDIACLITCEHTTNCRAINYNTDTDTCELVTGSGDTEQFSLKTALQWTSYFISLKDVNPLSNAIAWQSATYSDYSADGAALRAVDGNTFNIWSGGSCAHPLQDGNGEVWWMADFHRVYTVSAVIIWNRGELYFIRLTDILMTVGRSQHSMATCGFFKGPPLSELDNPVRTNCSQTMHGRFLKIEQTIPQPYAIALCEVELVQ